MKNIISKKIISSIIFFITITVLIFKVRAVFYDIKEYRESVRVLNDAKREYAIAVRENCINGVKRAGIKANYRLKIKAAKGYLYIPDTTIDYPVMQSDKSQPDFYLNHNLKNEYNRYGTPYLSAWCDINKSDNLIIYGHNVSGGHIFAALTEYSDKRYYEKHRYIYLSVKNEDRKYKIISVMRINKNEFAYWNFINAQTEDEYKEFINKVTNLSIYKCDTAVKIRGQLITLSTCDNQGGDCRFVIIAVRVKG